MRTLAIDTSRPPGSIALLEGMRVVRQVAIPPGGRTTQQLFPELQRLLADVAWRPADVQLLAVTLGPGSFTGLRIGIALAKVWAYATQCPVVAIDTLDILAAQAESHADRLEVVMDAERRQVFHARFARPRVCGGGEGAFSSPIAPSTASDQAAPEQEGLNASAARSETADSPGTTWQRLTPTTIVDQEPWLAQLSPGTAVTGDGLRKLTELLPPGVILDDASRWTVQASTLGMLGLSALQRGEQVDPWRLVPQYCRASAAEEKRLAGSSEKPV
jgi:tRNA threonylcarbamoyladenosine biosynthesis protein TsaB